MSNEPTPTADAPNADETYQEQDWGRIAICVVVAIIAALAIHYAAFEFLLTGTTLAPTAHALIGMVLFFLAGFASFSLLY